MQKKKDQFIVQKNVMKNAKKGDVIVLAGKGHEDYQEIRGEKYPMDERILVKETALALRDNRI